MALDCSTSRSHSLANDAPFERLDLRPDTAGSSLPISLPNNSDDRPSLRDFTQLLDPVDALPRDPFGMGHWLDSSDPVERLPSDPFEMNFEVAIKVAIAGWIKDFREIYDECEAPSDHILCCNFGQLTRPNSSDNLPADPFGMNLESTFMAAISGWMRDFSVFSTESIGSSRFRDAKMIQCHCDLAQVLPVDPFGMGNSEGIMTTTTTNFNGVSCLWNTMSYIIPSNTQHNAVMDTVYPCTAIVDPNMVLESGDEGKPHDALLFALGYLGLRDMLAIESVCRSTRAAVREDPLLWRCIHIDSSIGHRITDDGLLRLAERAQGSLECLILIGSTKITDMGLKRVLQDNPKLRKLNVQGCIKLTVGGIIDILKSFKEMNTFGIKQVTLGNLFNVSEEQFEELKSLLSVDQCLQKVARKPRFYHNAQVFVGCGEDSALDVELCPACRKCKVIYDCPSEGCARKTSRVCRACENCIPRCVKCGICIEDHMYEETFHLDYACILCSEKYVIV